MCISDHTSMFVIKAKKEGKERSETKVLEERRIIFLPELLSFAKHVAGTKGTTSLQWPFFTGILNSMPALHKKRRKKAASKNLLARFEVALVYCVPTADSGIDAEEIHRFGTFYAWIHCARTRHLPLRVVPFVKKILGTIAQPFPRFKEVFVFGNSSEGRLLCLDAERGYLFWGGRRGHSCDLSNADDLTSNLSIVSHSRCRICLPERSNAWEIHRSSDGHLNFVQANESNVA